jgi:hypothetical protein
MHTLRTHEFVGFSILGCWTAFTALAIAECSFWDLTGLHLIRENMNISAYSAKQHTGQVHFLPQSFPPSLCKVLPQVPKLGQSKFEHCPN